MTMQVGMLGADGIVIASDTRWFRSPLSAGQDAWHSYGSPKIKISDSGRIAVGCSRDMMTATNVAEGIFSGVDQGDRPGTERLIRDIGVAAASGRDIECIIAFADPLPCLYLFQYVNRGQDIQCQRVLDRVHTGDNMNPAVFWAMRYYRLLPINRLMGLAAHAIVTAGKLNVAMIGGLEMVFCDSSGFHRLPEEASREWEARAGGWDETIRDLILGPS